MKFIRTSSRVNDLNVDDSICLDISHTSQYLSQTNFEEWKPKYNDIKELIKNRVLNYRIPVTCFDFSKLNIFCDMNGCKREHPMRIEYRSCCQVDSCPVKFKIEFCEILQLYSIMQKANHIHTISDCYNNLKGIDEFWHRDLLEYAKKDIRAPKRIHSDLTDEYGKRIRVNQNQGDFMLEKQREVDQSKLKGKL